MRNCGYCTERATACCTCSDEVMCIDHVSAHIKKAGIHSINMITITIDTAYKNQLKDEIGKCQSQIQERSKSVIETTMHLIEGLTVMCNETLQVHNMLRKKYSNLLALIHQKVTLVQFDEIEKESKSLIKAVNFNGINAFFPLAEFYYEAKQLESEIEKKHDKTSLIEANIQFAFTRILRDFNENEEKRIKGGDRNLIVPRFGAMEMNPESHQKVKTLLRDIQQDTDNCNAFKVFNEPNKMKLRWVVKISNAAFLTNIENRIRNIMLKPDFDAISLLRCLSQAFKIKVNIQSLHYKCKICNGFQDGSFLPCSCLGYVHNQCLGSQLSFSLHQNVVFYGYFCNSCQSYHTFNYKELVLCRNCQNLTLSKAGSDFCLRCLSNQDSANNVIRIYKTLSLLCMENYSNITGLCSSCSGIPDVFMIGSHWSCYNCIFGAMIFDGFIQCQGKCCFMKLIPIEIQPIPIMKPDFRPMIEENKDRTYFQVLGKLNSIKEENKSRAPPVTGFQNNSKVTSISVHADTNTILPMPDKLKGKGITKYCSDCCAKEKNPNEIVFFCCGKFRCSMCKLESHPGKSCVDKMDNIKCPFCRVQSIPIDSSNVRLNCKGCKGSPKCLICLITHSSFTNCQKLLQEIHY